ncbi:MAG TPA: citrate (Si)-synthase [Candidatus Competibacteraceae bacterium]|nr:citrate (Si)-synthase [Candidatus Competibacteraceae bacterium]
MSHTCRIELDGKSHDFPVFAGTENELSIDISTLRDRTGYITLDDGYSNTGSCKSAITYIDGDKGILRYRGIPIEQLAEHSTFVETAWLVIWGRLPTEEEMERFSRRLTMNQMMHESLRNHFQGFPPNAHPMAILSAMINAMSCYEPEMMDIDDENTMEKAAARIISKVRTIAAASYKMSIGQPLMYPHPEYKYAENFLHMMFSVPYREYWPTPEVSRALNLFLILHADHEQNCSTSTVRMVASSQANMFASCAAGVCALWGPLHGGANVAVIEMLEFIRQSGMKVSEYVERVKQKDTKLRLMGFGHRVYKNFDPRSKILKAAARHRLAAASQRLRLLGGRLDALSPLATLNRGYAILRRPADGAILRRAGDAAAGDLVEALLGQGRLRCEIKAVLRADDALGFSSPRSSPGAPP